MVFMYTHVVFRAIGGYCQKGVENNFLRAVAVSHYNITPKTNIFFLKCIKMEIVCHKRVIGLYK